MKIMRKKSINVFFCVMLASTILIPIVNGQSSLRYINKSTINTIVEKNENDIATVYEEHYDLSMKKTVREPIMELNKKDAELLKQQLISISNSNISNQDKIKEQIRILHEWKIMPENLTYEDFEIVLNRMINLKNKQTLSFISPSFILTGPSITSTLAIGGDIFPIELLIGGFIDYFFEKQFINQNISDLLGGTNLDGGAIAGPVYVGFGPSMAFIAIVGPSTQGFFKVLLSPFIDIKVLFAGVHFTVKIYQNSSPITLFDWHINVALMGVLTYLKSA